MKICFTLANRSWEIVAVCCIAYLVERLVIHNSSLLLSDMAWPSDIPSHRPSLPGYCCCYLGFWFRCLVWRVTLLGLGLSLLGLLSLLWFRAWFVIGLVSRAGFLGFGFWTFDLDLDLDLRAGASDSLEEVSSSSMVFAASSLSDLDFLDVAPLGVGGGIAASFSCANRPPLTNLTSGNFRAAYRANRTSSRFRSSFFNSTSLLPLSLPSNPLKASSPVGSLSRPIRAPNPRLSSLRVTLIWEALAAVKWLACAASFAPRRLPGVQPWELMIRCPNPVVDRVHLVLLGSLPILVLLLTR
jgi:hypothetical protein